MDCSPPGSSVHEILQARILEWVAFPLSRGSSQRRDGSQVSRIAGGFIGFIAAKPPGKPNNPVLGSLSLLQVILPIQELGQGFLCCRWVLYQPSHQGSHELCVYKWNFQHS